MDGPPETQKTSLIKGWSTRVRNNGKLNLQHMKHYNGIVLIGPETQKTRLLKLHNPFE